MTATTPPQRQVQRLGDVQKNFGGEVFCFFHGSLFIVHGAGEWPPPPTCAKLARVRTEKLTIKRERLDTCSSRAPNSILFANVDRAILDAGLIIPDDVAVVGCGNVIHSDFLRIPLSSVDQDSAAQLALSLIGAKDPVQPTMELLTPRLVVRASSLRR